MKVNKGELFNVLIGVLLALFFSAFPVSAISGTIIAKHILYALTFVWIIYVFSLFIKKLSKGEIRDKFRVLYLFFFIVLTIYSASVLFLDDGDISDYSLKLISFILIGLLMLACSELNSKILKAYEFSLYLILLTYCFFVHVDFARIYAGSGNYLTATLPIGAGFIMAFVRSFDSSLKFWKKLILLSFSIFYLQSMTLFMGRGSFLICIILAVFYLFMMSLNVRRLPYLIITLMIIFYAGLSYEEEFLNSSLHTRLTTLSDGDVGERSYTYGALYNALSPDVVFSGFGFGVSGIDIYGLERYYPHNIHLHFLTDLGILGFIFSLVYPVIIVLGFLNSFRNKSIQLKVFLFLNLYIYMNFLKSFSMFDSWWLSLSAGILLSIILKNRSKDNVYN